MRSVGIGKPRDAVEQLSEDDLRRFEAFRRSSLSAASVGKVAPSVAYGRSAVGQLPFKLHTPLQLVLHATGELASPEAVVLLRGLGKMFVGDVIATGPAWLCLAVAYCGTPGRCSLCALQPAR